MIWMFNSHARAVRTLMLATVGALVVVLLVLAVRLHHLEKIATAHRPSGIALGSPDEHLAGPPLPDITISPSSPADPFPNLGDPRPIVIAVVNSWISGNPMTSQVAPAALEDMAEHAAPAGLSITGTATLAEPGPTEATVAIPTSHGVLDVDVAVANGAWSVQDLGWAVT